MADPTPQTAKLKIASHNTQGLNSSIKRRKAFHNYHSRGLEILLLQETHFPKSFSPTFLHHNYPTFFLAKKRGVAILLSKCISFTHSQTVRDSEGILVKGHINGTLFSLVSYYAPNKGQASFFSSMLANLAPHFEGKVITGGDSNITFDYLLDKSAKGIPISKRPPKQSLHIAQLLHSLGMIDTWS